MLNAPNRFGGGTGQFHGEQVGKESEPVAAGLILFVLALFVFAIVISSSKQGRTENLDENGCRGIPRVGYVCSSE